MSAALVSSEWDGNGGFRVVVEESWPRTSATDKRVRRAARKADPMGLTEWTRINDVVYRDGSLFFHVTASRLDRSYR